MYVTSPISWPTGKLLDCIMGEHSIQRYDNNKLRNLILLHTKTALAELGDHAPSSDRVEGIDNVQSKMIEGALSMNDRKLCDMQTPIERVSKYSLDDIIDRETLMKIKKPGFSRIPITYSSE